MGMDTQKFLEDARRATELRMTAAENIAEKLRQRDAAISALTEATRAAEAAFKEAEKAGWSKTELRRLRPADMTTKTRSSRPRKKPATPEQEQPASVQA